MFKAIGKFIKWFLIISVVIFSLMAALVVWMENDEDYQKTVEANLIDRIEKCHNEVGETGCDERGYKNDIGAKLVAEREAKELKAKQLKEKAEAERLARIEKAKAIQDERIAKAALARSNERKRISGKLTNGRLMCKNSVRKLAKYPSKLDYEGWEEGNIVENFTKGGLYPDRFWINLEGEWMNGIGNMIPFTAHCKLDMNSTTGKIVDMWIN